MPDQMGECVVCGKPMVRIGAQGGAPRLTCGRECRNIRARTGPREPKPMCSRCQVRPKALYSDGRRRAWCAQCEAEQKAGYNASLAGKEARRRYRSSPKGKAKQSEANSRRTRGKTA